MILRFPESGWLSVCTKRSSQTLDKISSPLQRSSYRYKTLYILGEFFCHDKNSKMFLVERECETIVVRQGTDYTNCKLIKF